MIINLTAAEMQALIAALENMEDIWADPAWRGRKRHREALRRAVDKAAQLAPDTGWDWDGPYSEAGLAKYDRQ